jgi:hypothetical protein
MPSVITGAQARSRADALFASGQVTHRLDMIGSGDSADYSGIGGGSVNGSIGSQWRRLIVNHLEPAVNTAVSGGADPTRTYINVSLTCT